MVMKYVAFAFALGVLAVGTTGCVRSKSVMLDASTAIISSRGSAFDSHARVTQAALVEAATLAVSRGYRYFVIVDTQDRTITTLWHDSGTTKTTGTVDGLVMGSGNSKVVAGNYSASTTSTPATTTTLIKPGSDVTVKMFREGELDPKSPGVWDAPAVLAMKEQQ